MERKLTFEERNDLERQHKKERDKRVCDRIKAVLAFDSGYSYCEIARLLLLDDETIRQHIKDYFFKHKLSPENGGSENHLSLSEIAHLKKHLREKTYLYVKEICHYVQTTFQTEYSISGMTKWLKAQGFCHKKPHGVPAKAEAEKQAIFINYYQSLKSNLPSDEVIYFSDSTHPQHQTRLAYGWIAKGIRKAEKMTACQKRVNIVGAINLSGHQIEIREVEWVNCESLKLFFTQLIEANPKAKKVHVIVDNAGYHKSKELLKFLDDTKIILHYLPPYSPNLNPIERLWKIMHEQVTYNRYYPKLADFKQSLLQFFENLEPAMNSIRSRITDNFQTLTLA